MVEVDSWDVFRFMAVNNLSQINLERDQQGTAYFRKWKRDGSVEEFTIDVANYTARELELMQERQEAEGETQPEAETPAAEPEGEKKEEPES